MARKLEDIITGMVAGSTTPASGFVRSCLEAKPDWKEQSFEYYAAHFLVGSGLIGGDLEGNIRGLADAFKKQYDVGVEHGHRVTELTP